MTDFENKVKEGVEADALLYFYDIRSAGDENFYRDRELYYGRDVWEVALRKVNPINDSVTVEEQTFTMEQCSFDLLTSNGNIVEKNVEPLEAAAWADRLGASRVQIRVQTEVKER